MAKPEKKQMTNLSQGLLSILQAAEKAVASGKNPKIVGKKVNMLLSNYGDPFSTDLDGFFSAEPEVQEVVEDAKEKTEEIKDDAKEVVKETKDEAKELHDEADEVVEEAKEEAEELVKEATDEAKDLKKEVKEVKQEGKEEVKETLEEIKDVKQDAKQEVKEVESQVKRTRQVASLVSNLYSLGHTELAKKLMIKSGLDVIERLQALIQKEYLQRDLYQAYDYLLLGTEGIALQAHLREHLDQEMDHIRVLQRYIVGMGFTPTLNRLTIAEVPANIKEILKADLAEEIIAVQEYSKLIHDLEGMEQYTALRVDLENIVSQEMEHTHDLQRYLGLEK